MPPLGHAASQASPTICLTRPVPAHSGQAASPRLPLPPQAGQGTSPVWVGPGWSPGWLSVSDMAAERRQGAVGSREGKKPGP